MRFKFKLQEEGSPEIEIEKSFFGKVKVYYNEKEAERLNEKGKPFLIRMGDGKEKKIFVQDVYFDYVPKVIVDGKEINLARKLIWYEYLLGGIPLILISGGMIGALIGILGVYLNFMVMRARSFTAIKALYVAGITIFSFLLYLVIALTLQSLIGR
jgi:hypothetical protein